MSIPGEYDVNRGNTARRQIRQMRRSQIRLWPLVLVALVVLAGLGLWHDGRRSGLEYGLGELEAVSMEASSTANLYQQALDANATLREEAVVASQTIDSLRSEVASQTQAIESLKAKLYDLQELERARQAAPPKPVPQSRATGPQAPQQTTNTSGEWSSAKVSWYGPDYRLEMYRERMDERKEQR